MRTQGEKKHVMAFKISAVSCKAEWDAHILQVIVLLIPCFDGFEKTCLRWFMPSSSCVSSTKELVVGPPWTSRQLDLPTQ